MHTETIENIDKINVFSAVLADILIHGNKERLSFLQMYGVSFLSTLIFLCPCMWAPLSIIDHSSQKKKTGFFFLPDHEFLFGSISLRS